MKSFGTLIFSLACLLVGLGTLPVPAARAAYLLTFSQVDTGVVASGSGSFNLAGLSLFGLTSGSSGIVPGQAYFNVGTAANGALYSGLTGPAAFGPGGFTSATSTTGNFTGLNNNLNTGEVLGVPNGYVSGASLASTTIFNNATIASLDITPGTYIYTWGAGANLDTLTINAVPEASSWTFMATGAAAFAAWTWRRRRA